MKPISDKLQNHTDRYSFVKRRKSLNDDKKKSKDMQAVSGRSPIGVKNVKLSNLGHDQILVINNFVSSQVLIYLRG